MLRVLLRSTIIAAALSVLASSIGSQALAQCGCSHCRTSECRDYEYGRPDLFYNSYVPPTCGGIGTQMYLAPQPVPPLVGHTYYTYQPFMPHEMLYKHNRRYHRYYNEGRGMTRTSVIWW